MRSLHSWLGGGDGYNGGWPSPLLIIIAILAIPKAWAAIRNKLPIAPGSQLATTTLKARYAAEYLGLVCFLTLMAFEVHSLLRH